MDTEKTMGRVSRPETVENYEFSKGVKNFWTFLDDQNRSNGAARGSTSIPIFFSGIPQYENPKFQLLACSGARHRRGAAQKIFPRVIP